MTRASVKSIESCSMNQNQSNTHSTVITTVLPSLPTILNNTTNLLYYVYSQIIVRTVYHPRVIYKRNWFLQKGQSLLRQGSKISGSVSSTGGKVNPNVDFCTVGIHRSRVHRSEGENPLSSIVGVVSRVTGIVSPVRNTPRNIIAMFET